MHPKGRLHHAAFRLLRAFVPDDLIEELEGDLAQRYHRDVNRYGDRRAERRLLWNVIRMLRPAIVFRRKKKVSLNYTPMLRNYFRMALRNLVAGKVTTAINLLGLTTGIAFVLIIATIIRYEKSFDNQHTLKDRIYRIVRTGVANGEEEFRTGISYPVPEAFTREITAIEKGATAVYYQAAQVDIINDKGESSRKFKETNGLAFISPTFFELFDFGYPEKIWLAGNPKTALNEYGNVVLTRSIAKKYFGNEPALGKTIRFDQQLDCKITGVVEDLPPNTDFPFTILVSYATVSVLVGEETLESDWGSISDSNEMYVLLPRGTRAADVEKEMHRVHVAHAPDVAASRYYQLQPIVEMHNNALYPNFKGRTVSADAMWTLAIVGLVMLVLVCVNYVNLATAQSTTRAKEIGMRKIVGSNRSQLIAQFLSEAFVITALAGMAGLVIASVAMDQLTSLTNVTMLRLLMFDAFVWKMLALIVTIVTVLAGFYPAIVISGMPTLEALRMRLTGIGGGTALRKTLVVFQFTATQVLVIAAFIAVRQLNYFQHYDLGFSSEAIMNVGLPVQDSLKTATIANKLRNEAFVTKTSFSSTTPAGQERARNFVDIRNLEQKDPYVCEFQGVDENYFDLFDIRIIAGRNFVGTDPTSYLIINESLVATLGYSKPDEAIGREVFFNGGKHSIIGVVRNFHANSLRHGWSQIAFEHRPSFFLEMNVKLSTAIGGEELQEAIIKVEKAWTETYPEFVFSYRFVDDNVAAYYREEQRLSSLLKIFSAVFLVIACLGLFGLISFVINRRMKEVAIRKVLGARILNILSLISRDYLVLIVISFVVAAPISYWIMSDWLSNFEYRAPITWWIVAAPGVLVLLVATLAISGRAWSAARSNPVRNLKYE